MNAYFSKSEARSQIGAEILSAVDFPDVPAGTVGRIVNARNGGSRGWVVRVKWELPPKRSEILAQVGEFSFNFPWRAQTPFVELSKSEVENLLKRVEE